MKRFTYTLYSLAAVLHASCVKACTCPATVQNQQAEYPFTAGLTFAQMFEPIVSLCAVADDTSDPCDAPTVCNCVDADFILPTPNIVSDGLGGWSFLVEEGAEVTCSSEATCEVSGAGHAAPVPVVVEAFLVGP